MSFYPTHPLNQQSKHLHTLFLFRPFGFISLSLSSVPMERIQYGSQCPVVSIEHLVSSALVPPKKENPEKTMNRTERSKRSIPSCFPLPILNFISLPKRGRETPQQQQQQPRFFHTYPRIKTKVVLLQPDARPDQEPTPRANTTQQSHHSPKTNGENIPALPLPLPLPFLKNSTFPHWLYNQNK